MSESALEARRAYQREWYARNKAKKRDYNRKHWETVARESASERQEAAKSGGGGVSDT